MLKYNGIEEQETIADENDEEVNKSVSKVENDDDVDFNIDLNVVDKIETKETPVDSCDSYYEFCETLLNDPVYSKGFEDSFFIEDENNDETTSDEKVVEKTSPSRKLDETGCIIKPNDDENSQQIASDVTREERNSIQSPDVDNSETDGQKKRLLKQGDRLQRDKHKHPLLPSCECKNRCITKVDEEQRRSIHDRFWELEYNKRLHFLTSRVQAQLVKRRKRDSKGERQRKESFVYSFVVPKKLNKFAKTFFSEL